jgi:hypothetical protein
MTGYSIRKSRWWKLINQIQPDKERKKFFEKLVFKFSRNILREFQTQVFNPFVKVRQQQLDNSFRRSSCLSMVYINVLEQNRVNYLDQEMIKLKKLYCMEDTQDSSVELYDQKQSNQIIKRFCRKLKSQEKIVRELVQKLTD